MNPLVRYLGELKTKASKGSKNIPLTAKDVVTLITVIEQLSQPMDNSAIEARLTSLEDRVTALEEFNTR